MIAIGPGRDLDAERKPLPVEPERDLRDGGAGEVEDCGGRQQPRLADRPAVGRRDARVGGMQQHAVADQARNRVSR